MPDRLTAFLATRPQTIIIPVTRGHPGPAYDAMLAALDARLSPPPGNHSACLAKASSLPINERDVKWRGCGGRAHRSIRYGASPASRSVLVAGEKAAP